MNPFEWDEKVCSFCGTGSKIYIRITISTGMEDEYPYTETDFCRGCWESIGIAAAFEHNKEIAQ